MSWQACTQLEFSDFLPSFPIRKLNKIIYQQTLSLAALALSPLNSILDSVRPYGNPPLTTSSRIFARRTATTVLAITAFKRKPILLPIFAFLYSWPIQPLPDRAQLSGKHGPQMVDIRARISSLLLVIAYTATQSIP